MRTNASAAEQAENKQGKIREALLAITNAGLTATVNGAPAGIDAAISATDELGVRLGVFGRVKDGAAFLYPATLVMPATTSRSNYAAMDAIRRSSCGKLFDRLNQGWVESAPCGTTQAHILIPAASDEEFKNIVLSLPSRKADSLDGKTIAELKFGASTPVSPSGNGDDQYALTFGERGMPARVTPSELQGIGVVLDEMATARDRNASNWYDIREHDARTNLVRDRYNRAQTVFDMRRQLLVSGWEELSTEDSEVTHFKTGGNVGDLHADIKVFVTTEEDSDKPLRYRAFDLIVKQAENSEDDDLRHSTGTAERAAEWLVGAGQVAVDIEFIAAGGELVQIDSGDETHVIKEQFAQAIRNARSSFDAQTPLAFLKTVDGHPEGVISITSSGIVQHWNKQNGAGLLQGAGAFVKVVGTGDKQRTLPVHTIPTSIVDAVMAALLTPGVLAPIETIASEPIITASGYVASEHGYDARASAFINLPYRDRARWARDYTVPDRPSKEQVQAAYKFIDEELLSDFCYATATDRARHLSYLLTCVGRTFTNGSIGFLANARDRGTGKSLALAIGRLVAQGNPSSQSFESGNDANEETRKQLAAALHNGQRFFHCDEIPRGWAIKGRQITAAITAIDGESQIRLLGGNTGVTLAGMIITLAGNAVELGDDSNRRFSTIHLAWTGAGSPVSRKGFRHRSLVGFINQNRPQLLAAAHLILLYSLQNEPTREIDSMGLTHNWPQRILGALSHITAEDGRDLAEVALDGWIGEVEESDEMGEQWGPLFAHLWMLKGDKLIDAEQIRTTSKTVLAAGDNPPYLPSVLGMITGSERTVITQWGRYLKSTAGGTIPFEGINYRLISAGKKGKHAQKYTMEAYHDETKLVAGRPLPDCRDEEEIAEAAAEAAAIAAKVGVLDKFDFTDLLAESNEPAVETIAPAQTTAPVESSDESDLTWEEIAAMERINSDWEAGL